MITLNKILLYVGLAVLLVTLAKISSAQLVPEEDSGMEPRGMMDVEPETGLMVTRESEPHACIPVEVLLSGHGFALKNNETYVLRINVERLMPLEPMHIRKLLESNKSLEEIRDDIRSEQRETTFRGLVKLGRSAYPLRNIQITPSRNDTYIVGADITGPSLDSRQEDETKIEGHLQVATMRTEEGMMGQGELIMNGTAYAGKYSVLLDMTPPFHENNGMGLRR